MDYTSLIAEFGANYGLGDLVPDENGAAGFEADGRPVVFQKLPDSGNMIVTVVLGAASEGNAGIVNRLLLQANQVLMTMDGMALYLNPETGDYCLIRRLDVTPLDFVAFDKIMETILDRAEQWGVFLGDFIALAAETDAARADEAPGPFPADASSVPMLRV